MITHRPPTVLAKLHKGGTIHLLNHDIVTFKIEVSESTVSREIKRNSTKNGKYVWIQADECAKYKKCRAPGNRAVKPELRWRVEQLIKDEQWSPKQIAGVLAKEGIRISHETIYKSIRNDETVELARNCRHKMQVGAR